ncbi:hypothetical protein, partial [Haliscomenobacter sp.]|uniref:hypothetical protein n=1 Tax=Haliscomenobacter sp. TaxID=2717303 RepID=UPI0033652DB2
TTPSQLTCIHIGMAAGGLPGYFKSTCEVKGGNKIKFLAQDAPLFLKKNYMKFRSIEFKM